MTQRRIPRCLPLGGLAVLIAAALLLALWGAVQAASPKPSRHDIIVLLDNSGSMVREYPRYGDRPIDPSDKAKERIAFARFLVRALQQLRPEGVSVGVALFAAPVSKPVPLPSTIPLVPLRPVVKWTSADVETIQQRSCVARDELDGENRKAFTKEWDACYGTHYRPALLWAQRELDSVKDAPRCGTPERQCDILVFTDGAVGWEENSDTNVFIAPNGEQALIETLATLKSAGIRTSVLLFDPVKNEKMKVYDPVKKETVEVRVDDRAKWEGWKAASLLSSPVPAYLGTDKLPATGIYTDATRMLGIEDLFSGFEKRLVTSSGIEESIAVPLSTASLRLELLSGVSLTDTYSLPSGAAVTPTVYAENTRWWITPGFGMLNMKLAGSGMIYYRATTEAISVTAPVLAWMTAIPENPSFGQPVQVYAVVQMGGLLLGEAELARVFMHEQPGGLEDELAVQPNGAWIGSLEGLASGPHTVTLRAEPKEPSRHNPAEATVTFQVGETVGRSAILRAIPETQFAGRSLRFEATFFSDGKVAHLPTKPRLGESPVKVVLAPGGEMRSLESGALDIWHSIKSLTEEKPGTYTASLVVTAEGWEGITAQTRVQLVAEPTLKITAPKTTARAGDEVEVTVEVVGEYAPAPALSTRPSISESLKLEKADAGRYTARFVMPDVPALELRAELPRQEFDELVYEGGARAEVIIGRDAPKVPYESITDILRRWWLLLVGIIAAAVILALGRALYQKWPLWEIVGSWPGKQPDLESLTIDGNWVVIKGLARHITEQFSVEKQTSGGEGVDG